MQFFAQQLITGLAVGGTYALVALGFVLIFGIANVLNIAHAESIMLPPFLMALLINQDVPAAAAFVAALILTVLIAAAIYASAIRPFLRPGKEGSFLAPFIASFGISLFIENILAKVFGAESLSFPIAVPRDVWRWGGVALVPMQVISMICVAVAVVALRWLVIRSSLGRAMRAVAENRVVAEAQGISVRSTILLTMIVATLLGALAGFLFAAGNNAVSPFMGMDYGLKGLIVVIIGGVTSLGGALAAGLILGIAESMTVGYISSAYSTVVSFGLLCVILVIRPRGLFTAASREGRP